MVLGIFFFHFKEKAAYETLPCGIKPHQVIPSALEKRMREVRAADVTEIGMHETRKNVVIQDKACEP